MQRLAVILALCFVICGCGAEPTFDATSDATVKTSMETLTSGLTDTEKQEFVRIVLRKGLTGAANKSGGYKDLHGKTAREILALKQ